MDNEQKKLCIKANSEYRSLNSHLNKLMKNYKTYRFKEGSHDAHLEMKDINKALDDMENFVRGIKPWCLPPGNDADIPRVLDSIRSFRFNMNDAHRRSEIGRKDMYSHALDVMTDMHELMTPAREDYETAADRHASILKWKLRKNK